ncbi:MAG: glycosyltransferase family 117 protein [Gemmatimonadales bacterium]
MAGSALDDPPARPPYRLAFAVATLVLLGYVLTLAPTVTFWDAGEFIAAAKTLGIPHPPGTPLFVLIAHVWALLVPVGEYAVRTNLLSAVLSAAAGGFFFLVAHATIQRFTYGLADPTARVLALGGSAAAVLLGAFTFTNWQNSNETEVYTVATFTIAAMSWLAHVWRRERGTDRAPRVLLLIVYLAGISIGNHLLALLAGPAIVMFMVTTLRAAPAVDAMDRRAEWGQVAVVAGVWALLIGTGLGSTGLILIGSLCFAAAAIYATLGKAGGFALLTLFVACIGITPYLYLYIRSAQNPPINEAAPATLDALLEVIRRAQYPPRTPFDDPTVAHGPDNPGRTLPLLGIQLADYVVYFTWQWAKSAAAWMQASIAVLYAGLGLRGSLAQRRSDRSAWWLLAGLFLVTGVGLVIYMNFRPGFGRWFDEYPLPGTHEVRERDYFFVVSFIVWGIWAGMGLVVLARALLEQRGMVRRVAPTALVLALVPFVLNWSAASRRHGPDARLAADFAYDLLNTAPPYGILFTYGDNDTFPLWWAQEVAGIRQDVTVVCLALANTHWYMRQLRDTPVRPVDRSALPAIWQNETGPPPDWPLHTMSDSVIASAMMGYVVPQSQELRLGPLRRTLEARTYLLPNEIVSLSIVQRNVGRRPIVWAITAGREFAGLGEYVVQQALGFALQTARPDTTSPSLDLRRLAGAPLDVPTTERLVWGTYRYGGLLQGDVTRLESTSASIAATLSFPFVQLAYAYSDRGEEEKLQRALDYALRLSPNPALQAALTELRIRTPDTATE